MSACNPYSCDRHFYYDNLPSQEDRELVQTRVARMEGCMFIDLEEIVAMWMKWNTDKLVGWVLYLKGQPMIELGIGPGEKIWQALKKYKGEV